VQTGMYRTGAFLASHHYGVEPDMVILAKALSGGLVPIGAVLMTDGIYERVYDSLKRAIIHTSTFSENGLAMRAGLATLDVLQSEQLGPRALAAGKRVRAALRESLRDFEMVKEVRGAGLFSGIEFQPPKQVRLRLSFEAFMRIHPGLFGQLLVMRMFRDRNILTQMCGNNFMVLKVAPPLTVSNDELDRFVSAITDVVRLVHSSSAVWTEALGLARRAMNI
jgi:ornithine--oxo-acid transaminase